MDKNIHIDVPGQSEDALQQKCVFWFWNNFPDLRKLLFSVPNGGTRTKREGAKLKKTGLTPGVSDLLFMYKGVCYCIELKVPGGSQKPTQKEWQDKVESQGFHYFIVWNLQEFKELINSLV